MKQKAITVDVAPDGSVKIEGHNFAGAECTKATKFLEDALGAKTAEAFKPEYRQPKNLQRTNINQ